jgi:hypothetical protein
MAASDERKPWGLRLWIGSRIGSRLLLAVLALEQWRDQLPAWLQRCG